MVPGQQAAQRFSARNLWPPSHSGGLYFGGQRWRSDDDKAMNDDQLLRYILLPQIGIEGQDRIVGGHALVIGAGGYVEFSALSSPPGAPLGGAPVAGFSSLAAAPGGILSPTGSAGSVAALAPEPGSIGLLMTGALGFLARRRRSR